ncbi:hypothetical protein GQ600_13665 [Phytophthora cactorum]|nr:hypothetical protein GQ600_13665 [Phytophthora cactorum]
MNKYTVTAVDKRYLEVRGSFTETITRTQAYHVSNGRKWNLVFDRMMGVSTLLTLSQSIIGEELTLGSGQEP